MCASRKDIPKQHRDGAGTVCGTVQAGRTPALPAGHWDGVAGGARGCWVFDCPSQARGPTGMLRDAARYAELEAVRRRAGQFLLTARLDIIHGARVLHRFDSDEALI